MNSLAFASTLRLSCGENHSPENHHRLEVKLNLRLVDRLRAFHECFEHLWLENLLFFAFWHRRGFSVPKTISLKSGKRARRKPNPNSHPGPFPL
jgi:hypothetical protein